MKILSVDRRRKHLVCVKTDEGDFSVDLETAVKFGLKPGMLTDETVMRDICHDSEFTRIKSKALWLLSFRDYSVKEMTDKLNREYDRDVVYEVVKLLNDSGLIDDERFAKIYAEELSAMRGMSRSNIKQELRKKGIERDVIDEITESLPDDEMPAIMQIIRQKYYNCFDDEKGRRRMFSGLARKGYAFDDIKKAINEYNENERVND